MTNNNLMYDLTAVVEKIKAQSWYEKPEGYLSMKGSVIVGMELQDRGNGDDPTLECSIYVQNTLGTGRNFDEAFAELEKKLGVNQTVKSSVVAII